MYFEQFFVDGLGCASYMIGCSATGVAAVIDPDRDVRKYLQAAATQHLTITHIIETHLHADHISGNTELAQRTGAYIYLSALGGAAFPHHPLQAGDVLHLGRVALQVRATPGHTPESICLLVSDSARSPQPLLLLTGDTLFVGDAGRPDLTGQGAASVLAESLYHTIQQEILPLADGVLLYPGHGSGSLCGKALGAMRVSSIGYERHCNPALAPRSQAEFVAFATSDLPEQPGNHTRIKASNRAGVRPLGDIQPRPLSARLAAEAIQAGAVVLDTRPLESYTQAHIPGSIHLAADAQLSNRVGFAVAADTPLVLLLTDTAQYIDVVYALARVGYTDIRGYLHDSLTVWERLGLPLQSGAIHQLAAQAFAAHLQTHPNIQLVDVREAWEYANGHIAGARLLPLGDLMQHASQLDSQQPVAVVCAAGGRSQTAATLLGRLGFAEIYNLKGGMNQWAAAGLPLQVNHS